MTLTLVVLGASRDECAQSPLVATMADELVFLANPEARWGGLGVIGNHYLKAAFGDVLGLVHADTMLSTEIVVTLTDAAQRGVAGIVGSRFEVPTVWSADIAEPQSVSTLDSCAMFISRALAYVHGLWFDTAVFDSFHCCVEDFCLQAAFKGLPVIVVPGSAGHPLPIAKKADWRRGEHKLYRDRLFEKWTPRGVTPAIT